MLKKSAKKVKEVSTGYRPRPLQLEIHRSMKRFNVLVLHRRFGKTTLSINEMIDQALRCNLHNPQYAYIAPTYKQAKMVAWEMFNDFTRNIPGVEVNKSELSITIYRPARGDKIKFMLLGAESPDALRGIYLDGCILDEYAQCDPIIWGQIIRPALSDRKGWAIFIGTPKGQNHFHKIFRTAEGLDNWYTKMFKASQTGYVDEDELVDARATMSEAEYNQEYECDFSAAIMGSYYGEIINKLRDDGRITDVPYNPALPVSTYWDLGVGDTTCIWFRQKVGDSYRYIDYEEHGGKGLEFYAKLLKEKPYAYGRHVWPHDGGARELGTGKTRQETMRSHGIIVEIQARQAVDDGIQAARNVLPMSYFDKVKCARGLEALSNYQREWDSKLNMFKNKPKHDWASNGADGFRISALDSRDDSQFGINTRKQLPRQAISDYNEFGG